MRARLSDLTFNAARRRLARDFQDSGIDRAALDARILMGHVTGFDAAQLIAHGTDFLTESQFEALNTLACRRVDGEPIDMILGYKDFWKDRFIVSKDVLSPRPETEGIIEEALRIFPPQVEDPLEILELGVGSGALILSLLREYSTARALGVDISDVALNKARANASALGLNCVFAKSDWFSNVKDRFDLIVSNPPYITDGEMKDLPKDVALHDPKLALHGGVDGLDPYRIITKHSMKYLKPNGCLIFEIGASQGSDVAGLMTEAGFTGVKIMRDLAGHDRIVSGRMTHAS